MVRVLAVVMAIGLVACGSDSGDADGHSGSRLKLNRVVFDDGTSVLNGMHDAKLGFDCSEQTWADGKSYCTPSATSLFYLDAACTMPAGQWTSDACSQPAPSFVVDYLETACTGAVSHLYARGAAVAASSYYAKATDGTCSGPIASTGSTLYALGAELPVSQLVELTHPSPSKQGEVSERWLQSADGMSQPYGLHDNINDVDCFVGGRTSSTTGVCVPSNVDYGSVYTDAQCSGALLTELGSCPPQPIYALLPSNDVCAPPMAVTVGAQVAAPAQTYSSNGGNGTCTTTTEPAGTTYFSIGSPITLPQLTRGADTTGNRRIQRIRYSSGNTRYADYSLYDNTLAAECYAYNPGGGETFRCYPLGGSVTPTYVDPACMQQIDLISVDVGPAVCPMTAPQKYATKYLPAQPGQCSGAIEIYEIGALYTGGLYQGTPASCTPIAASPRSEWHVTGATLPEAQLATAMMITDP